MKNLPSFLIIAWLLSIAGAAEPPPNFIVILTDDQGWGTTSAQIDPDIPQSKSDFFETPNIERLVAGGMSFTQAYAAHPNCSPSRASLLTGRSPAALHLTDIVDRNSGPTYVGNRLNPPRHITALPSAEQTIPELLKAKRPNYRAAHFGKWHLRGRGPDAHGFDFSDGPTGNAEGSKKENLPGDPKRCFSMTASAISWMKKQHAERHPFYLQISHYATHLAYQAKPGTREKFKQKPPGARHEHIPFAATIADMDETIGQLLDAVEAAGLSDNTYIIYTADNGTFPSDDPGNINGPIRGYKAQLWEGGVRVPFVVTGPGIQKNSSSRQAAIGWDILPTVCDLAGINTWPKVVEGGSLKPALLKSGEITRPRNHLTFHWPHYQHAKKSKPVTTLISGNFKLHYWWETDTVQLFNLKTDLAESQDIASTEPDKAADLRKTLHDYLSAIQAQLPLKNPDFDPANDPAKRQKKRDTKRN